MTSLFDEILGGYRPPRNSVPITLRADLLARYQELQREHTHAIRDDVTEMRVPEAPRVLRELRACQEELNASVRMITFEALPQTPYNLLLAAHPPRDEDRSERLGYNGETFPVALMAACAIVTSETGERIGNLMTEEQARELCAKISDGQFTKLWNAVLMVNIGDDAAPKGVLRSLQEALSSTSNDSATDTESLDQSSLAE